MYKKVDAICQCGHIRAFHTGGRACRHWGCRCAQYKYSLLRTMVSIRGVLKGVQAEGNTENRE